jgi:proteasome lid subunit RPN8/RPN11
MYLLRATQLAVLLDHVEAAFPTEAAGLLLREEIGRFTFLSVAPTPSCENTLTSFVIRDADIDKVADSLNSSPVKVGGCFHSHILGPARPSPRDVAGAGSSGGLWLIYSVRFRQLNLFHWNGSKFRKERLRVLPGC